jgi:hypothetical protein
LRLGLGLLQLVQTHERHARGDAGETLAHQHDVGADTVPRDHIGEPALIDVEAFAVALEPHPAMQHEAGQLVAGGKRKGRGRVEASAHLRSIDPEQADAPKRRDVDRVAIDDSANEHRI